MLLMSTTRLRRLKKMLKETLKDLGVALAIYALALGAYWGFVA